MALYDVVIKSFCTALKANSLLKSDISSRCPRYALITIFNIICIYAQNNICFDKLHGCRLIEIIADGLGTTVAGTSLMKVAKVRTALFDKICNSRCTGRRRAWAMWASDSSNAEGDETMEVVTVWRSCFRFNLWCVGNYTWILTVGWHSRK